LPEYKSVIDIGTNSFHMIISEILDGNKLRTVQREKVVMRLGTEEEGVLKRISPKEIKKAVGVLRNFKQLAEYYNADMYAIATSAVRESANQSEFVDIVKKETGIDILVIDGNTEANFIYKGVQKALPVEGNKVLCIDIGGGSTEVIIGQDSLTHFTQSYKLGAVRLSKMFFKEHIVTAEAMKNCSDYIDDVLSKSDIRDFVNSFDIAVGASGTIHALAAMVAADKYGTSVKDLNGFSFSADELKQSAELILKFPTFEERTLIKSIEKDRADILPAGILILLKLFTVLEIRELFISTYALKEGYLISVLEKENNSL